MWVVGTPGRKRAALQVSAALLSDLDILLAFAEGLGWESYSGACGNDWVALSSCERLQKQGLQRTFLQPNDFQKPFVRLR